MGRQPGLGLTPAVRGEGGVVTAPRVLVPGHRPDVRLPWYGLTGMTLVAVLILTGMWGGTRVVVRAAERLLTPAERVERMAKLQQDLGPKPFTPEAPAESSC